MYSAELPFKHVLILLQVDGGFLEGTVRGYKAGILTQSQYNNLTQCESLEGQYCFPIICLIKELSSP